MQVKDLRRKDLDHWEKVCVDGAQAYELSQRAIILGWNRVEVQPLPGNKNYNEPWQWIVKADRNQGGSDGTA